MSAVKATSNGSKGFSTQAPKLAHLLTHGLAGEVAGLYKALYSVLGLETCNTVDEWDGPGVGNTLQLSYAPLVRQGTTLVLSELLDGVAVSPVTGTLAQPGGPGTAWIYTPGTSPDAATAGVVTGSADLSVATLYGSTSTLNGLTLILSVNDKENTLTFNAPINPVNPPYNQGLIPPGAPYQALTLLQVIAAAFPGVTPTLNGSHYLVLTNKTKGSTQTIIVGPGTANTLLGLTNTSVVITGTADITAGALYGASGTLAGGGTGLTVILTVNGVGPTTLTFDGTGVGNDASEAAMLAAIHATWPALVATQGGSGGNKLVLTDTLLRSNVASAVVVGSGTANTALGLTPATTTLTATAGTGHSFAVTYEVDATQIPGAVVAVTGEAYSGGPGTGSPDQ